MDYGGNYRTAGVYFVMLHNVGILYTIHNRLDGTRNDTITILELV